MKILKYIIPAVVIKKIYDNRLFENPDLTNEERDAAEDAADDRD